MTASDLLLIGIVIVGFALVSRRIEGTSLTPPMLFVAAGVALGAAGAFDLERDDVNVEVILSATLALVLFADATRIDVRRLRAEYRWPLRMLAIGLPLTVLLGTVLAMPFGFSLWQAAVLAVVLAPTDAALGEAVVTNERVPGCIRQTLNVESGLNDGLALPLLTVALALAGAEEAVESAAFWVGFALREVGVAAVVGVAIGWGGGRILEFAHAKGWMTVPALKLAGVTLAFVAFGVAALLEGSGFIAAFVAGMAFGESARNLCDQVHTFAEVEGNLLVLVTFLLFGAIAVQPAVEAATWQTVVYALLSLTVIRMVPVAISLVGSTLASRSVWFLAWFGPRGLASILFGLIVIDSAGVTMNETIFSTVMLTVLVSIVLHGVSAAPLADRYAAWVEGMSPDAAEMMVMAEMPLRTTSGLGMKDDLS